MSQSDTEGDDYQVLTTRLKEEQHQALRMEAARQQTSMAELARKYVLQGLEAED